MTASAFVPSEWVADKAMSNRGLRLASLLLCCADSSGRVRLSLHQLTRLFRRGRRSVIDTLDDLEAAGYIRRVSDSESVVSRKTIEFAADRFPGGVFRPAQWDSDSERLAYIEALNAGATTS